MAGICRIVGIEAGHQRRLCKGILAPKNLH